MGRETAMFVLDCEQPGGPPSAPDPTSPSPPVRPVGGRGNPPGERPRGAAAAAAARCEAKQQIQTSCCRFSAALRWPPKELKLSSATREVHPSQLRQLAINRVQFSLLGADAWVPQEQVAWPEVTSSCQGSRYSG